MTRPEERVLDAIDELVAEQLSAGERGPSEEYCPNCLCTWHGLPSVWGCPGSQVEIDHPDPHWRRSAPPTPITALVDGEPVAVGWVDSHGLHVVYENNDDPLDRLLLLLNEIQVEMEGLLILASPTNMSDPADRTEE